MCATHYVKDALIETSVLYPILPVMSKNGADTLGCLDKVRLGRSALLY